MVNLAVDYYRVGRREDAIRLEESTLAQLRARFPENVFTINCMNNLAISYTALGRHNSNALELRKRVLALYMSTLSPDHPNTLVAMGNLANSYEKLGRHDEALKLYKETLAFQKSKLGLEDSRTIKSMNRLADSYIELGRTGDALKIHEEVLAIRKTKLGPYNPSDTFEHE